MNIHKDGVSVQDEMCEFCCEFEHPTQSRFARIYGPQLRSRVLKIYEGFAVLPTIGQFLKGSMLIVPTEHYECMAHMLPTHGNALASIIEDTKDLVGRFGTPVVFEHGAKAETGKSCGIYHAHAHVVPVPYTTSASDILPAGKAYKDIVDALAHIADADSYLLFEGTDSSVHALDTSDVGSDIYPSQFFRRSLSSRFGTATWDWRLAGFEQSIPEIVSCFAK